MKAEDSDKLSKLNSQSHANLHLKVSHYLKFMESSTSKKKVRNLANGEKKFMLNTIDSTAALADNENKLIHCRSTNEF